MWAEMIIKAILRGKEVMQKKKKNDKYVEKE